MVSSWDLAWLCACWRNSPVSRAFMLPPLSLARYAIPPVWLLVGLWSLLCPATYFLYVGLDSDLPLGFACPFGSVLCPRYFAPSCMLSSPGLFPAGFLILPLTPQNGVYHWAKGGLSMGFGFWVFLSRRA